MHEGKRVLVWEVPSRPLGHPLDYNGAYLMRAGEALVPMTPDQLRRIFAEGEPDWFGESARTKASADEVIALLDTQGVLRIAQATQYPTNRKGVLEKLTSEGLIAPVREGWRMTNIWPRCCWRRSWRPFHQLWRGRRRESMIYERNRQVGDA